jgi:hypothetical protein
MDQVTLAQQDSIDRVGGLPAHLAHPQAVRHTSNPSDLDPSCRQIEKEQHHKSLQPASGPYFHGKEIGGYD